MRVPFIDLSRLVNEIKADVIKDWQRCLDNCEFVGGPTVAKLEKTLSEKLQVPHVISCSNGTDAIIVGLQAMGIKPGMRVALPNMTFWAPYEAIVQVGAIPVLVDIDLDDLQMCFEEFKATHAKYQLDGAILVHLYGWASGRLGEYRSYCRQHGIKLIEDGAQSFGVKVAGEPVYTGAELGTISFYPAKVLGASGDAGAITSHNPKVGEVVRALCDHGRAGHYTYDYVGWNARLGGLQANFLCRAMERIDHHIENRVRADRFYQEFFANSSDLVKVYRAPEGVDSNGYLNVIYSKKKGADEIAALLKDSGIGCGRTYPQTLDMQPPAMNALRTSELKRSRLFSERVINLPLFTGITIEECETSAIALEKALKK